MEDQVNDYCLNFHLLRQYRAIEIEEWLDICIFIMIESNIQINRSYSNKKEEFVLKVINQLIKDTIQDQVQKDVVTSFTMETISSLKKQLLKNDYCCIYSLLCC